MANPKDQLVSQQYEGYPYPARNPADEKKRLIEGSPSDLAEIRHYLFAGGLPDTGGEPFRALIAGGGTGDAAIMLAQHCAAAGLNAEITYLDLSSASRRITEERAAVRGLTNLHFVTGSLLDAPSLTPGPFDYIDCCGVLHHLEDPAAGLQSLTSVLKPSGGMGLMVYGEYGRRGVYETQELLRAIAPADLGDPVRIERTKKLLAKLPKTNWLRRNPFVQDHQAGGDAGVYDLLLHARDRAYTVEAFAAMVEAAQLQITSFIQPAAYEPETYLDDAELLRPLVGASLVRRAGVAEILAGNMRKHVLYTTARPSGTKVTAAISDPACIPAWHRAEKDTLVKALRQPSLKVSLEGFDASFRVPSRAAAVASRIDAQKTIGTIATELQTADAALTEDAAAAIVRDTLELLIGLNLVLLSKPQAN